MNDRIGRFLADPDESLSAKAVVRWQMGLDGGFRQALWEAIVRADEENLRRLAKGFPVEVGGYLDWTRGDLAQKLREKGVLE